MKHKSKNKLDKRQRNQRKFGVEYKKISPKTKNQSLVFDWFDEYNLLLHGLSGTGKTFISCGLALENVLSKRDNYKKIVIIRSVVPTRDIGHLPGSKIEKEQPYELPYVAIFNELCKSPNVYDSLKEKGIIQFISTSHVRGVTIDNAIVIVDEINNMSFHELDSIITRLGNNTKIIFCGDYRQTDFKNKYDKSGLFEFMEIIKEMKSFQSVEFEIDDIVRSDLVKEYIIKKSEKGKV